ncbi:MAG TPA: hypothetical protein VFY81_14755 [Gammaproteobacteria bacterium]|nr:hypothetical protein [Gammaproteobacteria bacterium]
MSEIPRQDTVIDRTKLAALRLYTLTAQDRHWVLAQLSPPERKAVEQHLNRLRRLPVQEALALIEEGRELVRPLPTAAAVELTPQQQLLTAHMADVRPVLDALPAAMAAVVCHAVPDAAWSREYLAGVSASIDPAGVAPKALTALLEAVVAALPPPGGGASFATKLAYAAEARTPPLRRLRKMWSL